jgi:septal ring factor EnvC (AmiA/AmiB activator)
MLKIFILSILICCFSTSIHASEDIEARTAILQLRKEIKEVVRELKTILDITENESKKFKDLNTRIESENKKFKDLNTRLDVIENENKKLKDENERMRAALNNRLIAKDNPEYQELRDEINSINRLLFQIMGK